MTRRTAGSGTDFAAIATITIITINMLMCKMVMCKMVVMCTVLGAVTGATNYWHDIFSVDATTDIDGNAATTVAATALPVLVMPKLFARCSLLSLTAAHAQPTRAEPARMPPRARHRTHATRARPARASLARARGARPARTRLNQTASATSGKSINNRGSDSGGGV